MKKRINIAAFLKDCPEGTKLYSPICGECEYDGITELGYVSVLYNNQESGWDFDKYGYLCDDAEHKGECLLFPSKEVRDWGCFKVKYMKTLPNMTLGDIRDYERILTDNGAKGGKNNFTAVENNIWYIDAISKEIKSTMSNPSYSYILATGTELKLGEEHPKFKVGDVVKPEIINDINQPYGLTTHDCLILTDADGGFYTMNVKVANAPHLYKYHLASPKEIKAWNEISLKPKHLYYDKATNKIISYNPSLDDIVIVRFKGEEWQLSTIQECFRYANVCHKPIVGGLSYNENTAKLIGTTDDYTEGE